MWRTNQLIAATLAILESQYYNSKVNTTINRPEKRSNKQNVWRSVLFMKLCTFSKNRTYSKFTISLNKEKLSLINRMENMRPVNIA